MRAFVFLSALSANLRALRRAFLSGAETELLLSSEEEGLDGKREEALAPFLGFEPSEGGDGGGVVELFLPAAGAEGVGVYTGPVVLFLAEAEAEGDVVLLLAEAEAEGVGVLSLSAAGVERVDLLLSAAGVEGVGVLMSAAGVEGVEGEGVALPFSVEAGTTLAGVDEGRTGLGVATGLSNWECL